MRVLSGIAVLVFSVSALSGLSDGESPVPQATLHVDAAKVLNHITPLMYGSCIEDVNHEIYGGLYAQMIFGESFEEPPTASNLGISGSWVEVHTGTAVAGFGWDRDRPFNSARSQKINFQSGHGNVGVANQGLNRWGLTVRRGHTYAGRLYLRQKGYQGKVTVALQSADGTRTYAHLELANIGSDWARHTFSLHSNSDDSRARFAVWTDEPGTIWVDQVYLSGTGAELFHGLPFRADIGNMLVGQGLTVLRYGGSMVNEPAYRWKKMIGDRDRRPQYHGTWYAHSTNGFGIEDFVQFCDAAGFEKVFAINIEETPDDVADLVEYLNGPVTTRWGRRRAENGHPRPYGVKYIEIGNEEKTDAHYLERFRLLEPAMHARDPKLQLIIAAWWEPNNPVSRRLVRELNGKAALWDVHVGGDQLGEGRNVDRLFTEMERLVHEWSPKSRLRACVLEENGGRHDLQRALGHAAVLNATQRHGDFVLMDCPANCLQPSKQNDNGWDQGQIFFTSGQVWPMPPFFAQQMAARNHLPCRVASEARSPGEALDLTATRSEDGRTLVLQVVNIGNAPMAARIDISGFKPSASQADVWSLTGRLTDVNTPAEPERVRSRHSLFAGSAERFSYTFLPRSYTILRLRRD